MVNNTPQADEELQLDRVDTYENMVKAIHSFAKRLAKQSLDMDEQVKNYNMLASQKEEIVASTIESFVYAVIKTREKASKVRDEQREREVLNDLLGSAKVRTIQVPDWQTVDGSGELEIISTRWIKERLARLDSPKSDLVRPKEADNV